MNVVTENFEKEMKIRNSQNPEEKKKDLSPKPSKQARVGC